MSIATVITRGFGTFGSVNKLPTLGYGGDVATVANIGYAARETAAYTVADSHPHYAVRNNRPEYVAERS